MTKHRLLLSAAAAALLAQPLVASADTTITTSGNQTLNTTTDGNITINQGGGVDVKSANGAAIILNSNNWVTSEGSISNTQSSGAVALEVDTTAGNLVAASPGISNFSSISVDGDGSGKAAILVTGGHTYFGDVTLGSLQALTTTGSGTQTVTTSNIVVQGDSSSAFYLVQGTKIDGDITFAGSISQSGSAKDSANGGAVMIDLDGMVNGNVIFDNTTTAINIGNIVTGVTALGGIHGCASDSANFASGFACDTTSSASGLGAFVNLGSIGVVGTGTPNPKYVNFESGSAVVIAGGIDAGFENAGPGTSDPATASAHISANGTSSSPTVVIDPALSITVNQTTIRGPVNIGPVPFAIDPVDPGYSVINRGSISALPVDPMISAAAVYITGSSATNFTCLSATVTASGCNTTPVTVTANGATWINAGGLLDTGTISATAITNQQTNNVSSSTGTAQAVTANALTIGPYAYVPRLDIMAEDTGAGTTAGTIAAAVNGTGQGGATAIAIAQYAKVPEITVGLHASVSASVTTTSVSPTSDFANSRTPFVLSSEAIVDASGTLQAINNSGSILALNSVLTPAPDAVVVTSSRAIDLAQSNASNIIVNNNGTILGDVIFGSAGNGDTLNVGNTGTGGAVNAATGTLNTPSNYAVVAQRIDSLNTGQAPSTETNTISFGSGTNQMLHVGGFGYVNSVIEAAPGALNVQVDNQGQLFVATSTAVPTLNANNFNIASGGTLGLTITQLNTNSVLPAVLAQSGAMISSNAKIGLQFGSFISSGTSAATINAPTTQNIILVSAPGADFSGVIAAQNPILAQEIPFLFNATSTPLVPGTANGNNTLVLSLTPRVPGKGTTANPGLGLSGDALMEFPSSAAALANDQLLGAAIATNLTVYNTNGVPTSGINLAASQQKTQQVFSQFGPDTSGGARQVAIMLTDEASGPVAARQRLLRNFSDEPGEMTLWGEEFSGNINNKGRVDADGSLTNYKDHGFGFSLGLDGGSPQAGWYGGAFTYYSGDVSQTLPRDSITHTQWYMLTGYSEWRGRHLFLDTQGSLAYGDFLGHRDIVIGDQSRDAVGKRAALMGALGANSGVILHLGGFEVDPHVSLDGLSMREEGYTETNGGEGFDLQVAPYYANSLRAALGADLKKAIDIFDITLLPEARLGYRYDLMNSPTKLRAGFASTGGLNTAGNALQFVGPDPDTGNLLGGFSLGASTDTWQLGVNYDWLRGSNGSTTQVGIFTLLGRI